MFAVFAAALAKPNYVFGTIPTGSVATHVPVSHVSANIEEPTFYNSINPSINNPSFYSGSRYITEHQLPTTYVASNAFPNIYSDRIDSVVYKNPLTYTAEVRNVAPIVYSSAPGVSSIVYNTPPAVSPIVYNAPNAVSPIVYNAPPAVSSIVHNVANNVVHPKYIAKTAGSIHTVY